MLRLGSTRIENTLLEYVNNHSSLHLLQRLSEHSCCDSLWHADSCCFDGLSWWIFTCIAIGLLMIPSMLFVKYNEIWYFLGAQFWGRHGTRIWGMIWELNLGPWFGTPIWDPDLGPRFGTLIWDPDLRPRFGTPIWDPDSGPWFGTLIRDPDLGPPFGTLILDLDFGHPHLGPLFWTLIYDLDLGHPHLGPRLGTPIWDPDSVLRFGTLIWDPDLGPQFF
jgi:hypothetical protein